MTDLPPYARLLRLSAEEVDGEHCFRMPFHEDVVGRPSYLHGGAIAGLLEFAAFQGLRQALHGQAVRLKPVTVTVDYMRGGGDQDTFASAKVLRLGRSIANVEAAAWQSSRESPIATARITFLLDRDQ